MLHRLPGVGWADLKCRVGDIYLFGGVAGRVLLSGCFGNYLRIRPTYLHID